MQNSSDVNVSSVLNALFSDHQSKEMLVGFKKESSKKDFSVYKNITVTTIRPESPVTIQNVDLLKVVSYKTDLNTFDSIVLALVD